MQQVLDRHLHERRLIKHHLRHQLFGYIDQLRQRVPDSVDHRNRVAVSTLLQNRQIHRPLPIHAHNVRLNLLRILRMPDIADQHRCLPHRLDRHLINLVRVRNLAIGVQVVIDRPDLHVARGQNEVALVHRAHHIHHRQLVRIQLQRIDIHHNLPVPPAKRLRHRCSLHARNLVAHRVLPEITQLRLIEPLPFQRDQAHRQTRRIELEHHGRQSSRRQPPQIRHREIRNHTKIRIRVRSRLEVDLDQAHARQRSRLDVIDPAPQRKKSFEWIRDAGLDLLRRHSRIEGRYDDYWNVDRREQVHRHSHQGHRAHNRHHQTKNNNEEGIPYSES